MFCFDSGMSSATVHSVARRTARLACLLVGLASLDVAVAQDSGPAVVAQDAVAPLEYESEIGQALGEHAQGNYEQAREHFLRAHAVYPNARTLRGLGKVEFELRDYRRATEYLEAALSSPVRPLPPDLRDEVQRLLTRARAEAERAPVALNSSHAVAPGPRVERSVGDSASPIQQERASAATPVYRKWWVWTITGAAVAGVVTAVVLATRDPEVRTRPVPGGSRVLENP
jgi:hypothetical protein